MSYTLKGRLQSRLAALAAPLGAAYMISLTTREWWPVGLAAAMVAVVVALDLAYHPLLPYQPGWLALPLGLLELGLVMAVVLGLHVRAPLAVALGLFAAAWVCAQLLGQAVLPWWRLSYAEDGGELGRTGLALVAAVATLFVASAAVWYAQRPPIVHLASGVHRGPLVISGDYRVVPLTTLDAEVEDCRAEAINDVVALSSIKGRMAELAWALGGEDLGIQPCDGLICATPSGSTAYNLSNGGPVLVRGLDAMAVTFIAAHSLHARPMVVPRGLELQIRNQTPDVEVTVLVDGHALAGVGTGAPIVVRLGEQRSLLATLPEATFFRRYRETFGS